MSADLFDADWQAVSDLVPRTPTSGGPASALPDRRTAKAQQRRTDRHDAVELWREKRAAVREDRAAARAAAREHREEQRADRAAAQDRFRTGVAALAQRVLVVGPILAPMAVAWTGQSQFAIQILNWAFVASLLYAAAYELTTVYWAWLYHQARTDGDSGWEYRLATWVFAAGAAVQQWWHYSDHWDATPRAVTYSVMSAVGVLLWEGRARLLHRRSLRAAGKTAPARPRIGLVRWVRYPVRSWTAWSLTILEGHRTLEEAWAAAERRTEIRRRKRTLARAGRTARRTQRGPDRSGPDRRPGPLTEDNTGPDRQTLQAGPPDHTVRTTVRTTARSGGPDHEPPDGVDRTTAPQTEHESGPDHAVRTSGPGLGPADPADRTEADRRAAGPQTELGGSADRLGPPVRTARSERGSGPTAPAIGADDPAGRAEGRPGPDQETGPRTDRTAVPDLVLTETERKAVEILRTTDRAITKRAIAAVVREELGRSIASERAAEIARHCRALRVA